MLNSRVKCKLTSGFIYIAKTALSSATRVNAINVKVYIIHIFQNEGWGFNKYKSSFKQKTGVCFIIIRGNYTLLTHARNCKHSSTAEFIVLEKKRKAVIECASKKYFSSFEYTHSIHSWHNIFLWFKKTVPANAQTTCHSKPILCNYVRLHFTPLLLLNEQNVLLLCNNATGLKSITKTFLLHPS